MKSENVNNEITPPSDLAMEFQNMLVAWMEKKIDECAGPEEITEVINTVFWTSNITILTLTDKASRRKQASNMKDRIVDILRCLEREDKEGHRKENEACKACENENKSPVKEVCIPHTCGKEVKF